MKLWRFPNMRMRERYSCVIVATSLACTVFFTSLSWTSYDRQVNIPMTRYLPPSLRQDLDDPECSATYFQKMSEYHMPPVYVSTRLSQKHNASKSSPVRNNKNSMRLVVSSRTSNKSYESGELPTAHVITPTYARSSQKADLLRLCYTLMHVPKVHWIVVEDSEERTDTVTEILANCHGPSITHLAVTTKNKTKHRGVIPRNAALDWIHRCLQPSRLAGGVFFADDDNTYDLLLFEAVRWTQIISIWPVGTVGAALWEGPICTNGKVTGWEGNWGQTRKFPVDMAAFSIGLNFLLLNPRVRFRQDWPGGYLETRFLESLFVSVDQLNPEPDPNCSQVLAWHTKTSNGKSLKEPKVKKQVIKKT